MTTPIPVQGNTPWASALAQPSRPATTLFARADARPSASPLGLVGGASPTDGMDTRADTSLFRNASQGQIVAISPWGEAFEGERGVTPISQSFANLASQAWFPVARDIVLGFIPGVGEVQDAVGLVQALQKRDATGALANGLSLAIGLFDPTPVGKAAVKGIFKRAPDAAGLLKRLGTNLGTMPANTRRALGQAIQNAPQSVRAAVGERALQLAGDGVDGGLINRAIRNYSNPESTLNILQSAKNTLGTNTINRLASSLNVGQINSLARNLGPQLTDDMARAFAGRMDGLAAFADRLRKMPQSVQQGLAQAMTNVTTPVRVLAADLINAGLRPSAIKDVLAHTSNPQGTLQQLNYMASRATPQGLNQILQNLGVSGTFGVVRGLRTDAANQVAQQFGDELLGRLGKRLNALRPRDARQEVMALQDLAKRELSAGAHSIQRHGADVSDTALKNRLTTGIPPGDTRMAWNAPPRSTRFHSYNTQNFLQKRGLDEALQHLGLTRTTPPSAIGLTRNTAPQVTIDWGTSIGTGFKGINPKQVPHSSGGTRPATIFQGTQPLNPNDVTATTIGLRWNGSEWQVNQFYPGVAGTGANAIRRTP